MLLRIDSTLSHPLHNRAQTRALEARLAGELPGHTLMRRAGLATARLAHAIAPHARHIWIACGAGNNGGDGLEAAMHLQALRHRVSVCLLPGGSPLPADAQQALQRAQAAGVPLLAPGSLPDDTDLVIDALWGIGIAADAPRPLAPEARWCLEQIYRTDLPVLSIDTPSGLDADTGQLLPAAAQLAPAAPAGPRHTVTMLTLKPGLFTGAGRDWSGTVWLDSLHEGAAEPANGWLSGRPALQAASHNRHKGSFGDVLVIGGEAWQHRGMGMEGAAVLAASAALHAGAGRVLLHLLGSSQAAPRPAGIAPEIMLRSREAITLDAGVVVCGCGGGELVQGLLPEVLQRSPRLVLDADALNAIAATPALQGLLQQRARQGWQTVVTPHPLEAARLLQSDTAKVQAQRIQAAQMLAARLQCLVVLKGSGTVIAAPGGRYAINASGNALLATGGTGDVLAGCLGAHWARLGRSIDTNANAEAHWQATLAAVWQHGHAADTWPAGQALTASRLAESLARTL
ncbi:bifunctional ADP-dependent NAD(P)H-hydrate dehydratase/NAD(P)H-hydrate epimerase [Comamonas humi]